MLDGSAKYCRFRKVVSRMKTVSLGSRNRKTPLSRCNGKTANCSRSEPGRKEIDMESITLLDAVLNVCWILASALVTVLVMK